MLNLVEMGRANNGPLFPDARSQREFMERAHALGKRWKVKLLAFRLESQRALMIVDPPEKGFGVWCRLLESGYGVWFYTHYGPSVEWMPLSRLPLPEPGTVRGFVHALHEDLGRDPLIREWGSLWDAIGLRIAPWFDPTWLRQNFGVHELIIGCKGRPEVALFEDQEMHWASLGLARAAVAAATGQDADRRAVRVLVFQVARRCGWTNEALAEAFEVKVPAVRKALRLAPRPELQAALAHLRVPRLRARLTARGLAER